MLAACGDSLVPKARTLRFPRLGQLDARVSSQLVVGTTRWQRVRVDSPTWSVPLAGLSPRARLSPRVRPRERSRNPYVTATESRHATIISTAGRAAIYRTPNPGTMPNHGTQHYTASAGRTTRRRDHPTWSVVNGGERSLDSGLSRESTWTFTTRLAIRTVLYATAIDPLALADP